MTPWDRYETDSCYNPMFWRGSRGEDRAVVRLGDAPKRCSEDMLDARMCVDEALWRFDELEAAEDGRGGSSNAR